MAIAAARRLVLVPLLAVTASATDSTAYLTAPFQPAPSPYVVIRVPIKGASCATLLFDTGTAVAVLTRPLAALLGLASGRPVRVTTLTGEAEGIAGRVKGLGFDVGAVRDAEVIAVDEAVPPGLPADVRGIFGHNLLDGADYLIDYSARRVVLARGGRLAQHVRGRRQPLELIDGRPAVRVLVSPRDGGVPFPIRMVIDSGIDGVTLFGRAARRVAGGPGGTRGMVRVVDQFGSLVVPAAAVSLEAGERRLEAAATLLAERTDRREDGLLSASLFTSVYVSAAEHVVVLGGVVEGLSVPNPRVCE
jgi:hypothetical protein